jgi:hypothetical protein
LIPGDTIMTTKAHHSTSATRCPSPLVLFGIDSRGKPKAARFGKNAATLALKAATQLQLRTIAGDDPKIADIAARLPVGRVHATGKAFVPFVRRDLYDKLLAAAGNGNGSSPVRLTGTHAGGAATASPPSGNPNLPRSWDQIALGDLVVAQESLEDGWYEAIVIEVNGDMLTLRWRDYPRERKLVRHRLRVGLRYPGPQARKQPKPQAAKHHGATATVESGLPADWQDIDLNKLVLAKDDGPSRSWWEAIPVEKTGDTFKLRWRDHSTVPPISRERFALALICPDAA